MYPCTHRASLFQPYQVPTREPEETKKLYDSTEKLDKFEEGKKSISKGYYWLFATLISLVVGIQITNESNINQYLQTYLVRNNGLSSEAGAYCLAMLSTTTIIGRIVNIFLTMKISIQTFLFINFSLMTASFLLIMVIGSYSLYGVYGGILLFGFGLSNTYPLMLSFVEERITMTDRTMALLNFTPSGLLVIIPVLIGNFLDTNPSNFMMFTLVITLVALTIYIVLIVLETRRLARR